MMAARSYAICIVSPNRRTVVRRQILHAALYPLLFYILTCSQTGVAQFSDLKRDLFINLNGAVLLGEKNARVTIVEFSDYQCPLSSQYFNGTMGQILDEYVKTGKVRYAFRDFPIESIHPRAITAAEAAHCAGDQGKYWEMHDRMLRNQAALDQSMLPLHASMLRLDVAQFTNCLNEGRYTKKIRESVQEAKKAGVRGTPIFFIGLTDQGGQPTMQALTYIEGVPSFVHFKNVLDALLLIRK